MRSRGEQADTREKGSEAKVSEGISALVAKVLDQLSVSAWLPAALLVVSVAVLLEFRAQRSADLGAAIKSLTVNPVRVLLLIIPLLVISTMITQAFAFSAIRFLEGYGSRRSPLAVLRGPMIGWQVRKRNQIIRELKRAQCRAFGSVRCQLLERGKNSAAVVNAVEVELSGAVPPKLPPADSAALSDLRSQWRYLCHARLLAPVDELKNANERFPPDLHRTLPTRLGNVIRATEDRLKHVDGDLQGFALRRRQLVPARVQAQHDQFRSRLDMYCTLVFVCGLLAMLTPALLDGAVHGKHVAVWPQIIIVMIFLVLAFVSYSAAIASAGGYCAALRRMDRL